MRNQECNNEHCDYFVKSEAIVIKILKLLVHVLRESTFSSQQDPEYQMKIFINSPFSTLLLGSD